MAVLLLALTGIGQNGFNNYYQSGKISVANKVNYKNPNEFILTSYYIDSTSGQQGLDLKLINNVGIMTKRKRIMFDSMPFLTFYNNRVLVNISNSTMLVTAASATNNASAVIFASVNKSTLDTNWFNYYADGVFNYYINNTFKVGPNEIWFMGGRGNNTGYNERPTAFKTDTLGNILSIKEFTALVNYTARVICYEVGSDRLYIAGDNFTIPNVSQSFVACVDTMGNVIWNKQIGSNPNKSYFSQIDKTTNSVILCGNILSNNQQQGKLSLLKLSSSTGTTVWQKTYGLFGQTNFFKAFTINADESITATGEMIDPAPGMGFKNGIIFKANSNGDSLWLRSYSTYTGNVQEGFMDIVRSPDGGYVMCGSPLTAQNCQSWVVKTDSLGFGPGIVVAPVDTTTTGEGRVALNRNLQLNLYPNPTKDSINIGIDGLQNENCRLVVYNDLGEIVKEQQISFDNKNSRLNCVDLPSGLYTIQIIGNSSRAISGRFVVFR